jgi:glycosyltransferase involved in cell wall biosynthesis
MPEIGQLPGRGPAPLVSVVIPTYNRAAALTLALDSVHAQTHRPIEVVVVDDGSTDDTSEVIARWGLAHQAPDFVIECVTTPNQGAARARNEGIARARGTLIALLDSDDLWRPTKLARQAELLASSGPEVGMVYTGVAYVDAEGHEAIERPKHRGNALRAQLRQNVITGSMSGVVIRREVIEHAGGFDEGDLPMAHDYEWFIRVLSHTQVDYVDEVLVMVAMHGEDRLSNLVEDLVHALDLIRRRHLELIAEQGMTLAYDLRTAWLCQFGLADQAAARRRYADLIRAHPSRPSIWVRWISTLLPLGLVTRLNRVRHRLAARDAGR